MNESQNTTPVVVLAAYVEGRNDGFKSGVIFAAGAIILYKAVRKSSRGWNIRFVRNNNK